MAFVEKPIVIGARFEILPAYSSETESRSIYDEIAGCEAEVTAVHANGDVDVWIRGIGETCVWRERLKGATV